MVKYPDGTVQFKMSQTFDPLQTVPVYWKHASQLNLKIAVLQGAFAILINTTFQREIENVVYLMAGVTKLFCRSRCMHML